MTTTEHNPIYKEILDNGTELQIENTLEFEFDLEFDGVEGLDKVEERVSNRMTEIVAEEAEKICFGCGSDRFYDKTEDEYYCHRCDE